MQRNVFSLKKSHPYFTLSFLVSLKKITRCNTIQNKFYDFKASHSRYLYLFMFTFSILKMNSYFLKNKKLIACMKRFKNLQDFRFHLSSPVSFLTINMQTSIFSCYVYIRARFCIAGARYPPARKMKTLRVQK